MFHSMSETMKSMYHEKRVMINLILCTWSPMNYKKGGQDRATVF